MKNQLTPLGQMLGAFATDLGDRLDEVTVVAMTEFGRRVEQNASGGTDHGHGSVVLLLGGGLAGGTIHGQWPGLAPEALDHGDVAGANDYRDVLGEVVSARLGIGLGAMGVDLPRPPGHPAGGHALTRAAQACPMRGIPCWRSVGWTGCLERGSTIAEDQRRRLHP